MVGDRGGAAALRRIHVRPLVPGVRADLAVLHAPCYVLACRPGVPLVTSVWRGGRPLDAITLPTESRSGSSAG